MRGTRIPVGKRIINDPSFPPINPLDQSEANADHLMLLWDNGYSGDYIQDAAILARHLARLLAEEQNSPNLTLFVQPGIAWFGLNTYVNFAGGSSPAFAVPISNPRRDILTLRNDGTLHIIQGTEAASPVAPQIPSTDIPLCQVFNVVGQTVIHDNDTQVAGQGYIEFDLRPMMAIAAGVNAMPKIGLVSRVQFTTSSTSFVDAVNFIGAGRLRSIYVSNNGGGGSSGGIKIILDGTTLFTLASTIMSGEMVDRGDAATTTEFKVKVSTDPPAFLDTFFKNSLEVQVLDQNGGGITTVIVEYEHE